MLRPGWRGFVAWLLALFCCFCWAVISAYGVAGAKPKILKSPAEMVEFVTLRFEIKFQVELQKHQNHGDRKVGSSRRCYYEPHPPKNAQKKKPHLHRNYHLLLAQLKPLFCGCFHMHKKCQSTSQ